MKGTTEQINSKIKEIEEKKHIDFLVYLLCRWEDEKQYENWEDYEKIIKEKMNYLTITKITKRPFGIVFKVEETEVILQFKKKGNKLVLTITYE